MDDRVHEPLISVYHMEKYIIPGAAAVLFVFLLPQALLQGITHLQHVELVPALIACFVLGHLMESLRIYRLIPTIERNWRTLYIKDLGNHIVERLGGRRNKRIDIDTLAYAWDERGDNLLTGAERSELAWNLVRWQKMISLSVVLFVCTFQWVAFAVIQWLKAIGDTSPLLLPTRNVYLAPWVSEGQAAIANLALAGVCLIAAVWLAKTGLNRQKKSNRKRLAYIMAHGEEIEVAVLRDADQQFINK